VVWTTRRIIGVPPRWRDTFARPDEEVGEPAEPFVNSRLSDRCLSLSAAIVAAVDNGAAEPRRARDSAHVVSIASVPLHRPTPAA
jgi:hypothetical protein